LAPIIRLRGYSGFWQGVLQFCGALCLFMAADSGKMPPPNDRKSRQESGLKSRQLRPQGYVDTLWKIFGRNCKWVESVEELAFRLKNSHSLSVHLPN
jgi:hypothetical protein